MGFCKQGEGGGSDTYAQKTLQQTWPMVEFIHSYVLYNTYMILYDYNLAI